MDLSTNILDTLKRLCSFKSTSGTFEETEAAESIYSLISESGYFKEHRDNLKLHEIKDDPYGRKFITALYTAGSSKKTVVLLSHFDVVGVEEFGHLKDFAYDPEEYTKRLKDESLPKSAKEDLKSGEWLFGRGIMDMKCGLAIHIELLRYIYENNVDIGGNILLLTVPDEENNSAGMLSAVDYLSYLKDVGFEFSGAINSEPYFEESSEDNRYIYTGTIGKLLPFVFFAGLETHVVEPFTGISSSLLSSITTYLMEANTDLLETYGSCTAPPPVCLKQEDIKPLYSVSTPSFSYAYYNYFTLVSSPSDVLDKMEAVCLKAFRLAVEKMDEEHKRFSHHSGKKPKTADIKINVLTYSKLCKLLEEKNIYVQDIKDAYEGRNMDTRDMTACIIMDMLKLLPSLRPAAIIGFAPPYYPHRIGCKNFHKIMDVCSKAIDRSRSIHNEELLHRDVFPGLCDMSYLGFQNPDDYFALESDMPVFGGAYKLPVKSLSDIDIGGINIGVMGRDAHKNTERLNMPYSFNVTPDLVLHAIMELLS